MKPKLDHIGLVVKNMEKTLEFFSRLFEVELPPSNSPLGKVFRVIDSSEEGGVRWAMLPTDGLDKTMIELLEPVKENWLMDFLKRNGDMSVAEICFRVDDIEKFHDKVKDIGLVPVDYFGTPLIGQKYFLVPDPEIPEELWAKCFYINLPLESNQGPAIEITEYPEFSEEKIQKLLLSR